jgi:hypothetical protein
MLNAIDRCLDHRIKDVDLAELQNTVILFVSHDQIGTHGTPPDGGCYQRYHWNQVLPHFAGPFALLGGRKVKFTGLT